MGMEALSGRYGSSIYLLCVCIAFVFVTVSTPTSQFKGKGYRDPPANQGESKLACMTFWGRKSDCTQNPYDEHPKDIPCPNGSSQMKVLFQVAEAFAIISIFVTLASAITAGLSIAGSSTRLSTIMLALVGCAVVLIPWACMAAVNHRNICGEAALTAWRSKWKYSAGFGLFVTAWCIQVVGTVCLIAL